MVAVGRVPRRELVVRRQLQVRRRRVEQAREAGHRRRDVGMLTRTELADARAAERDERRTDVVAVAEHAGARRVVREQAAEPVHRHVLAADLPEGRAAVDTEDVERADRARHRDLEPGMRGDEITDRGLGGDTVADHGEDLTLEHPDLHRPARQVRLAGGLRRVRVRVVRVRAVGRDHVLTRVPRRAGQPAELRRVERLVVLLLRADDDLRAVVAVEIARAWAWRSARRRHRLPSPAVNVTLCQAGSDRLHLRRVDHEHREPGDRRAVVVPRVHVAVERGADELGPAVAVEVSRRRASCAKPRLVRLTESCVAG